jgi:hypothetical protein
MSSIPPSTPEYNWPIPLGGVRPNVRLALKDFGVAVESTVKAIQSTLNTVQSTLNTVKAKADAAMPKSGGKFTGKIQVPDGESEGDAVNKRQLDAKPEWQQVKDLTDERAAAVAMRDVFYGYFVGRNKQSRGGKMVQTPVLSGQQFDGQHWSGAHDITMYWTFPLRVGLSVDNSWQGFLVIEPPSERDLKTNIERVDERDAGGADCLGFVNAVPAWTFRYISPRADGVEFVGNQFAGTEHIGFMADEVADAVAAFGMPADMVHRDEGGNPIGFSDRDMLAVAWTVIRDLTARVDDLGSSQPMGNLLPDNVADGSESGTVTDIAWRSNYVDSVESVATAVVQGSRAVKVTRTTEGVGNPFILVGSSTKGALAVAANAVASTPIIGGQTYTLSAMVWSDAGSEMVVGARIFWRLADGTTAATVAGVDGGQSLTTGTPAIRTVTAVAPTDAVLAYGLIGRLTNGAETGNYYVDAITFHRGAGGLWSPPGVPVPNLGTRVNPADATQVQIWNPGNDTWITV